MKIESNDFDRCTLSFIKVGECFSLLDKFYIRTSFADCGGGSGCCNLKDGEFQFFLSSQTVVPCPDIKIVV